jgi:hypothetical protein
MSGAAGHLSHLFEDRSLTFGNIKEVLTRAAQGKLEHVTEKFDGFNLVFTWHSGLEDVRVARSGKDIVSDGMDMNALAQKFEGRGNIKNAFINAYQILCQSLATLQFDELIDVFGQNGRYWYSMEIIYSQSSNTICYDSNNIIFHEHPVFIRSYAGTTTALATPGSAILMQCINKMQKAVAMRGWKIMGPSFVNLEALSDGTILKSAIDKLDELMAIGGADDNTTISDYVAMMALDRARGAGLNVHVATAVAKRIINDPKAANVSQLVKMSPGKADVIRNLVSNDKRIVASFIKPIEQIISDLAVEVLRGLHSTLVRDSESEVARLKSKVKQAINAIESSGDDRSLDLLNQHLERLRDVDNIATSMEGIVFIFNDKTYKLTGAWAPVHQILSLSKRLSE